MLATISINEGTQENVQKWGWILSLLGVLELADNSEWVAISSSQPKPKYNQLLF